MQTIFDEKAFLIISRPQYFVILRPVFRENQLKLPFLCRQAPSNRGQRLTDGSKQNATMFHIERVSIIVSHEGKELKKERVEKGGKKASPKMQEGVTQAKI